MPTNHLKRLIGRLLPAKTAANKANDFFMAANPRYKDLAIGEWSYGKPRIISYGEGATVKIGRFCSIADNVTLLAGGEHRTDWVTTYPFSAIFPGARSFAGHPTSKGDIIIENDVWIAQDVRVLSGVRIGNGAVIAAGAVVTKDVAPYTIVGGNPARFIRNRFTPEVTAELEKIAWWNWPLQRIAEAWPLLLSGQVDEFIAKYKVD